MTTRYITVAQAERMRRQALAFYEPPALQRVDILRRDYDEYYIVPDDDPRLQDEAPDPRADA